MFKYIADNPTIAPRFGIDTPDKTGPALECSWAVGKEVGYLTW
jgi:hypothetical protein